MRYFALIWKFVRKYWEIILGIIIGAFLFLRKANEISDISKREIDKREKEIKRLEEKKNKLEKKITVQKRMRDREYEKAMKEAEKVDKMLKQLKEEDRDISYEDAKKHIREILEKEKRR